MQQLNTVVSQMITLPFNIEFDLCLFSHVIGINWKWVWVDSGSRWWTGRPSVLWFMGLQRVGHNWATELNWTELKSWLMQKEVWGEWDTHLVHSEVDMSHINLLLQETRFLLWGSSSTCPAVLPSPCQAHLARPWHWRRRYFPSSGRAETCFSPAFWRWSWLHCV